MDRNASGWASREDFEPEVLGEIIQGSTSEFPHHEVYMRLTTNMGFQAVVFDETKGPWIAMLSPCCTTAMEEKRRPRKIALSCSTCSGEIKEGFSFPLGDPRHADELLEEVEYFLKVDTLLASMLAPIFINNAMLYWSEPSLDDLLRRKSNLLGLPQDLAEAEALLEAEKVLQP